MKAYYWPQIKKNNEFHGTEWTDVGNLIIVIWLECYWCILRALLRCDLYTRAWAISLDLSLSGHLIWMKLYNMWAFVFGFFHFACFEAHPCYTMLLVAKVFLLFDNNPFMWIGHIFFNLSSKWCTFEFFSTFWLSWIHKTSRRYVFPFSLDKYLEMELLDGIIYSTLKETDKQFPKMEITLYVAKGFSFCTWSRTLGGWICLITAASSHVMVSHLVGIYIPNDLWH